MQKNKNWTLYILRLEQGKYYVGITTKTPEKRLWEHQNNIRAAYWTKLYRPEAIIYQKLLGEISEDKAKRYENKMVRACFEKYGLNNVRGGNLTNTADYVRRFKRYYLKENWEDAMHILAMLIIFAAFCIDKYLFVFIPGGIR